MINISEDVKRRYTAFWNREDAGRACIYAGYWDGSPGFSRGPSSVEEQWGGLGLREESTAYNMAHSRGYCEWIPSAFVNFGPGSLAACIGGSYKFAPSTVWFENQPLFVQDWDEYKEPALDRESPMYKMVDELTERFLKHKDTFITSICDVGGTMDVVASLRGTQNLLYDMYDYPDEVTALRNKVAEIWREYFTYYSSKLLAEQGCMTSWMSIWSDKPYYPLQCDYCAMISPDMFRKFVLPDLEYQTSYMDRSIYHLDGPGELPHLDMILGMKNLNAIQWTSGDGNPSIGDDCWVDIFRRMQKAGKGIVLFGLSHDQMDNLFRKISQRGVYVSTWFKDEKEAAEVCEMCERRNLEYKGGFGE